MSGASLKLILEQVKSDKIKERQEGLAAIQRVFAKDHVVAEFHITRDGTSDPRVWLAVFQSIFQAVRKERELYLSPKKGSTATVEQRLSNAAGVVRWLAERTVTYMNKRVTKAVFEHVLQVMVHKGALLSPVAADYVKILRCLVSWKPHVDHLDEITWIRLVELGFNVVLGDPINGTFEDDDDSTYKTDLAAAEESMDSDGTADEDIDHSEPDPSLTRKRRRPSSASTPQSRAPAKSTRSRRPLLVSTEQIEFISLLSILLGSVNAPLLSANHAHIARSILLRFQRFLDIYPNDTSLHHDYLSALSAALSHLSLNRKQWVSDFALSSWEGLVGMWGTKNKTIKENLVTVLRELFPFMLANQDTYPGDGIWKLWQSLDSEAENRWGINGLSIDVLRLGHSDGDISPGLRAFIAKTFSAGFGFDASSALSWAILELQADCAQKLFLLSESSPRRSEVDGKRTRWENPITSLLANIRTNHSTPVRSYRLQILLFIIDRHWVTLHKDFQQAVVDTLLQLVSSDDGVVQCWIFICFAAVVYADGFVSSGQRLGSEDSALDAHRPRDRDWDTIWMHSIRRASVPLVSRAACHTACSLLIHSQSSSSRPNQPERSQRIPPPMVTSPRILADIEALAKDLDVQGPLFPYDSVCAFLSQCLKFAGQDVRLYRMHVEDKVLSWLTDSWTIGRIMGSSSLGTGSGSTMPFIPVTDIMKLLESICGVSKRSALVCRLLLPECQISLALEAQASTRVIRDFLLHAKLPDIPSPDQHKLGQLPEPITEEETSDARSPGPGDLDLSQPRSRERKLSLFLQKGLEALLSDWEALKDGNVHPLADTARHSLDLAVVSICWESLLNLNGTRPNRHVIQLACKLLTIVTSFIARTKWTSSEIAFVLLSLEPLWSNGHDTHRGVDWAAMLPPGVGTGIKSQILTKLRHATEAKASRLAMRLYQRTIWKSADLQEAFDSITPTIKNILLMSTTNSLGTSSAERDAFGPIRLSSQPQGAGSTHWSADSASSHHIIAICISYLSIVPTLQTASGESTRDQELTNLVLDSAESRAATFLLVCPIFLDYVGQRTLKLSTTCLDKLLLIIGDLLNDYSHSKSERLQHLAIHLLESTSYVWLDEAVFATDVGDKVRQLCQWLSTAARKNKIGSWRVRDALCSFLDRYMVQDPKQTAWRAPDGEENIDVDELEGLPISLLPMMGGDEDVRVRFRAAVVNAGLFAAGRAINCSPLELYNRIKQGLTVDLSDDERMLTRVLSLGNTMIVSSAVRRGAYWHLLETCLNSSAYTRHIEAILYSVARRMGLASLSCLFEAYASQIAFSICKADYDFLRFPPHLLGYRDRTECARATFRAFSPSNLLAGGNDIHEFGERLFRNHCKVLQKSPEDGVKECFGVIVGYQLVLSLEQDESYSSQQVEALLRLKARHLDRPKEFDALLRQNVDGIVAAILSTLGDQDFSQHGPIHRAVQDMGESRVHIQVFQALVRYRRHNDFATHTPNLPAHPTPSVLRALEWFHERVPESASAATTYHVLHRLFAAIHESPLVNEQMRLINAIALWIAVHHNHFSDRILIHLLAQNATSLIVQSDLAHAAQSMIEWAFNQYHKTGIPDNIIPDVLNRICHTARDYAASAKQCGELGKQLIQWIDAQAVRLSASVPHRELVLQALATWSHNLSPELRQLCDGISVPALSQVLVDHRVSSNKFLLVRQWIKRKDIDDESFSRKDFWRFKECIPPIDELHEEDIHNFIALILAHKGHIDGFGIESPERHSAKFYHRTIGRKLNSSTQQVSPQHCILFALLDALETANAADLHRAYETLRLLLSCSAKHTPRLDFWPSRYGKSIEYLQKYPPDIRKSSRRDIQELKNNPAFLDSLNDFERWIGLLTTFLGDILSQSDPFYAQLTPTLESDPSFSEQSLPVLVYSILEESGTDPKSLHRRYLSEYFSTVLKAEHVSVRCLSSIVDTVLHLRQFPTSPKDALGYNNWLDVDYTCLAQSAITCGAYTTALLFSELAAEYSNTSRDEAATEQILFEIYSHMDEPDGFYGIKTLDLHRFLIRRFHHEQQWDKAFRFHGAGLEASMSDPIAADGLLRSYHSFGFNHLAIHTLQTSLMEAQASTDSSNMSYRLGWRTETWDLPDQGSGHSSSLYRALRAIHRERDPRNIDGALRRSLSKEMERLRDLGAENLAEIHEVVQNLMCLHQISRWKDKSTLVQLSADEGACQEFADVDPLFEFSDLETIISTRISLVRSLRHAEERTQMGNLIGPSTRKLLDLEKRCLLRLSNAARHANQNQIALNAVIRAQKLESTPSFEVSHEFACVLWLQKEEKSAVQFLNVLLDQVKASQSVKPIQEANLLARLGSWSSEACLEKPTDILSKFFGPAAAIINDLQASTADPSHASVYHQCAIFADRQYHLILKSPDAERWRLYVDRKKEEIKAREHEINQCTDNSKRTSLNHNQKRARQLLENDQQVFKEHNKTRDAFLVQAMDMYSRCLESSDGYDSDAPIRLCSLWFANFDEPSLQDAIAKALSRISSRKFVFLAHQLTARLAKSQAPTPPQNQANLQGLVLRMCIEHPFHSLQQVYCLQPDHVRANTSTSRRQSSRQSLSQPEVSASQAERGDAAREILDRLRTDENRGECVRALEQLCDASLQWATVHIKDDSRYKKGAGPFPVPTHLLITRVSNLRAPVLTAKVPLDTTLKYDDCVWVERFAPTFTTAGGINMPKITVCYGSDGKQYKQLFKGEGQDDLRQDAVMEQVFELVNVVLSRDRETRRRSLGIRGYKVIPLASQAGILEFVGNTLPLGHWLPSAHVKYRPQDLHPRDVQARLKKLRDPKIPTSEAQYITSLVEIRKNFKPVMRHYFPERHRMPMAWFAMRLNYTRSVATTSIVGHVLGLGDRHVTNILLDTVTGEVVHIDLGISFEQGKLLPVPERVPFRMTPDMVDGMGTTGTQGVFQRCAEETLRVLREGSDVIMTVLEVFKYDPLHSWAASEVKLQRVQGSEVIVPDSFRAAMGIGVGATSGVALEAADRALSAVARKLDKGLSVEYTVNQLIAEATDVTNLALMWPGWSNHL